MKIAIVTDGNLVLGLGHVYQSITLAKLLEKKDIELQFFTKSETSVCDFIKASGFQVNQCLDDEKIFLELQKFQASRIIFDKLDVSPDLSKKIKNELTGKLIIFTNLTAANDDADMMVLADVNYKNIVNKKDKKIEFLGPKFWILREEFYDFKKIVKNQNNEIKNVMLIFGGADPENLTGKVLKEFLVLNSNFNVLVVVGRSFAFREELNKLVSEYSHTQCKVQIVSNVTNVGELMFKSDLVFTSPGLTFFEALIVGTPVVGFHQNDQQKDEFKNIFPTLGASDLSSIKSIIENKLYLSPGDSRVKAMEIGEGRDEILMEIFN